MQVWPAIDLLGGKCVRLQQGDYLRDTVFSDRPADMAQRFFDAGAQCLHCVDLDGARSGSIENGAAIQAIVERAEGRPVQLGGGVRNEAAIERLLELGLSRLVVGTAALKDPSWFAKMCDRYAGHVVLGLDAKQGLVATEGWTQTSQTPAVDLIQDLQQRTSHIVAVVYTDISRDGMLQGPDWDSLQTIQKSSRIPVIASGGVTTLSDIDRLIELESAGCIIGRSLYEGRLDLGQVLRRAGCEA